MNEASGIYYDKDVMERLDAFNDIEEQVTNIEKPHGKKKTAFFKNQTWRPGVTWAEMVILLSMCAIIILGFKHLQATRDIGQL